MVCFLLFINSDMIFPIKGRLGCIVSQGYTSILQFVVPWISEANELIQLVNLMIDFSLQSRDLCLRLFSIKSVLVQVIILKVIPEDVCHKQ